MVFLEGLLLEIGVFTVHLGILWLGLTIEENEKRSYLGLLSSGPFVVHGSRLVEVIIMLQLL